MFPEDRKNASEAFCMNIRATKRKEDSTAVTKLMGT
jgi:hypothetical protein